MAYESGGLQQWTEQAKSDAAPEGLRQTARGRADEAGGYSGKGLQQWVSSQPGYVESAQQWYTGRNTEDTGAGWDTEFTREFNSGWNAALENGTAVDYFDRGTGVVLWDHTTASGKTYAFGDVVKNGQKSGNLYDDFDRDTANLMLLPWLADGEEQARLWEDNPGTDEVRRRMGEFVESKHAENNANLEKALGAAKFSGDVAETQSKLQSGLGDEALAAGGAAVGGAVTGAGTGAAIGSVVPGAGTATGAAVGAVVGGVAGFFGGLLNKDEIAEAAARGWETYQLSAEEHNGAAAASTALREAAGLTMKFTSPLQNLVRGAQDTLGGGEWGDGEAQRYAVDDKGESKSGLAWKVADWTALAGDSVMQFVSPLNRAVYTAQMSGSIGGEVGELTFTGGEAFDPRRGGFDNIFLTDDGRADPVSGAAGILKVGIDAVQLGGLRGLARQADRTADAVGAGQRVQHAAGMKFVLDEAGNVTKRRATMALLAPSEQVSYATAARKARVAAMKEGRAVSVDDFYRAATQLSMGSSKLKTALVNGFAEGYEEFAQALLEPVSHDGEISGKEAATAFLYGAAAGTGMSLGATFRAPNSDARLKAQAYVLETMRRGGVEPGWDEFGAEWDTLDDSEKRARAARSQADSEVIRQATAEIGRQHATTMVASELDAAKALDANRSVLEAELRSATERTDAFHVMSGLVDVGRVDPTFGTLIGDTAPAEAVEASAATVYRALANRLRGYELQIDTMQREIERLDANGDIVERDAAQQQLAQMELSRDFGRELLSGLAAQVEQIYAETTTEAEARRLVVEVNQTLRDLFEAKRNLPPLPDSTATPEELRLAAAQFVSLIQSREPKLDTGSYLALMPRVSIQDTLTRSDNYVRVNTDILQAINGDFDGDKLRAENQLIVSAERFVQARAGQNFGGAGRELDVATRNFDAALVTALGQGLREPAGQMHDAAQSTMDAIESALYSRYGSLMNRDAWTRVWDSFTAAVNGGSEDARVTLLNGLAAEAGEAITDLGRERLSNEWLWASKVVRANLNAYQTQFAKLRNLDANGDPVRPTDTADTADIDTPRGTTLRKRQAVNTAQTLALFGEGNSLFRKFQKIHYTWYNSSVLGVENAEPADLYDMARLYEELSQNITRAELERAGTADLVAARVLTMLSRLVDSALEDPKLRGRFSPDEAMTILANVKVHDAWFDSEGPVAGEPGLSLVQVLMRRALDAEREEHKATFESDEKMQAKHARLRALTVPNHKAEAVNAERAFLEVFKGVRFSDSLGGLTGNLAAQTTPEQWLRNYISHDPGGRQDLERFYTNTPEYLDRAERSNLPYSMLEAERGEVTAYRSMMDAMLAVGRDELTFDPAKPAAKAFGGRLGKLDADTRATFKEAHGQLRQALSDFRTIMNRTTGDRVSGAELMQQMLEANPREGKLILDMLPDARANALYGYDEVNDQLYVSPWLYEVLAMEDSEAALFGFWKNLTIMRWEALRVEDRSYTKLQTRFERLLYELSLEPGQIHMEGLIRKMHEAESLDEFFVWLNSTPGYRATGQAPLLPFVDDVADFEADAAGGWQTTSTSSDLRSAITAAKSAAGQLAKTIAFRENTMATDRLILDDIKDALAGDTDPRKQEHLRKLREAVQTAHELPRGFAPAAMLALTRGVVNGVDAHSHDKGQVPTSYERIGEFQALMDAFGFVPGLERVMEVVTAHNLDSLRTNLGDLASTGGTAMDAFGRQITWEPLTVEQAVEMLDDPRTAPLAYALLTPSAMDVTKTGLAERLLMDASLKDLLDGDHYKRLFDTEAENQLAIDTEYLSVVDARARSEGGSFDAVRAANDLAITMLSGLGRKATIADEERLTAQAYHHVATVLRMVGKVQATPEMRDAGTMETLRKAAVEDLRRQRVAHALPDFTSSDSGEVVDAWVAEMRSELEKDFEEDKARALQLPTREARQRRIEGLQAQHTYNMRRLDAVLDDDLLASTVARYELTGDPVTDQVKQARIVEYVTSMTNFPTRAPEAAEAWTKLAGQRRTGGQVDLTASEWDVLARAAMGISMVEDILRVSTHVSIPALPKAPDNQTIADSRFYKYFDPSFSWIATDLLDGNSPLGKAASWLHLKAEQVREEVPVKDLTRVVQSTITAKESLGTWTPGLMSQLVATQERMDSAGAPQGIAAAGNGPKRWATIAAATRRTGEVPDASLLTSLSFTADFLAANVSPFTELAVTPAGSTAPTSMPLALLENRFYGSIKIDGTEIPLDDENLGFTWQGAETDNPYRYVSLERLRPVVQRYLAANKLKASQVTVEVEFFHPDSQPVGMWNNAFFEGMSHSLLPDGAESLIATLWSDNGGRISTDTQWTIDAGKKGQRAIQPFRRPEAADLAAIEALWETDRDLAAMLRAKTSLVARYDDGSSPAGAAAFNALHKIMKLQHVVVTADGQVLTAEEAIALRAAQPDALNEARLVVLSTDVLRTMLGETGDQGVDRFFDDEVLLNPSSIPAYEGLKPSMLRRFARTDGQGRPKGFLAEPGSLADTPLRNVGQQRVMRVRTAMTSAERNARVERRVYLEKRANDAYDHRDRRGFGKSARDSYSEVLRRAMDMVSTEQMQFDTAAVNAGVIGPRNTLEAMHSVRTLETFNKVRDAHGLERGWRVVDAGQPDYLSGTLTMEALHDDRDRPEHWVVANDLALLELNSFQRPEHDYEMQRQRVEKALDFLTTTGAYVVLGSGNGTGDLRFHASRYLESRGYVRVNGAKHLYAPAEYVAQTQNERAYASTQVETSLISPADNIVTFLAIDPVGTDENGGILNPDSVKLRDRKVLGNLAMTTAFSHYGLLSDDNRDSGLYARTLNHLREVLDPTNLDARAALLGMGGKDADGAKKLDEALDDAWHKITSRSSLEPEVGETIEVGDILFLVHPDGKVLLYRHGFELPSAEDVPRLLKASGGRNVMVGPSRRDARMTANSGKIRDVEDRAGYGKRLVLEVPLQPHGDKVQLEFNGMKYVLVPKPESMGPIPWVFRNGTVVDIISDVASADAKEAIAGRARGIRNSLAFFQFDFLHDMVQYFYPGTERSDSDYAEKRVVVNDLLTNLADQDDVRISLPDADAIAKAPHQVTELLTDFALSELADSSVGLDWVDRLFVDEDATTAIARAVLIYLLTPGAHPGNVLKSAGFSHPRANDPVVQTRLVPGLFADLLDQGLDSKLHEELISRFDSQLLRNADGSGWRLNPDWTVEMIDADGGTIRGYLQFGQAHSSGDNPVLDGQAFDPTEAAPVSWHNAMAANLSFGAMTAHKELEKSKRFSSSFAREANPTNLSGEAGATVWDSLVAVPDEKDLGLTGWRRETPAETLRRALAREELVGFHQPLNTSEWSDAEVTQYQNEAARILGILNLHGSQRAMVDTWVRQHLGRPHGLDEHGNELGVISHTDAMQMLSAIRGNLRRGLLPVTGANVPLMDVNHLTVLYQSNVNKPDGRRWKLKDTDGSEINSWDGWVDSAFGVAWIVGEGEEGISAEPQFHQMYLLAVDGLMHGYQGATTSTRYLPVSSDSLRQRRLMAEDTNQMLVSISDAENLLATDPALFASTHADLEDILSGQRIYAPGRNGYDPASARGYQEQRINRWHREVDAPRQVNKKIRGVRSSGQMFVGYTTSTNSAFRSMMNLRVGNTLFNLSLTVSAPFEALVRRTVNGLSAGFSGEGTGAAAKAQARLVERFADTRVVAVAEQAGLTPTYTSEQMSKMNELAHALAAQPEFKAMVLKELLYQYPSVPGIGKIEKWLEAYAKFGAKLQDPTIGFRQVDLAKTYLAAVMRANAQDPTGENTFSIERMLTALPRNPEWLKDNDLEAHNLGIAAIANVRSVKPNVLSLGFRGLVEPLSENPKLLFNSAGNMLKVLTAFQNFWANFGTSVAGLQGPVDFMAFWLDGREKKVTARIQRAIRGDLSPMPEPEFHDMTEALESLDLADSFIKGGVTHTGLFTLGMMAAGLGLSGEDDETKRRRRAAELQGVPVLHDPRDLAADFRNRDSIYLDWLPFGMDSLFRADPNNPDSRAIAQMNWVSRVFLSPIIGFERFYNTGDFSEILYGFKDAVGSHPIVNSTLWNEASDTASYLHEQANDAAEKGEYEEAGHFLITAVGVMEKMLFENSMMNLVYVGMDEWDRDPYVTPLTDSDGEIQRDIEGNARPNDLALQNYIDEATGQVSTGYLGRSQMQADRRVLTENRGTMALVASLFTGGLGESDYWRYNMPIKTREIERPELSQEEAEAYVRAAVAFQLSTIGGAANQKYTAEELKPQLATAMYDQAKASGIFDPNMDAKIWAASRQIAAESGTMAASLLDDVNRREVLTDKGARYIFNGLREGTLELGELGQLGVFITREQRQTIMDEWTDELVQEGIDYGLDETKARSRMARIMQGSFDSPEAGDAGLADLLWDSRIPYDGTVVYGQLNTTYVMGPDGRPWATGFKRDGLLGALGLAPLKRMLPPDPGVTGMDERGNTVDLVNGMNTGLRGLVPFHDSRNVPTDEEIGKAIEDAIAKAAGKQYTPNPPFEKDSGGGRGWRSYGGRGYSGYSGGGYSGGGGYFNKMYSLPGNVSPYGNTAPAINTSNPILRRAFVRRERVWSERGRLNQWQ